MVQHKIKIIWDVLIEIDPGVRGSCYISPAEVIPPQRPRHCKRETGAYTDDGDYLALLDQKRIAEEEQLDGYYVICTNVIGRNPEQKHFNGRCRYTPDGFCQLNRQVTDNDIIGIYKGLWRRDGEG